MKRFELGMVVRYAGKLAEVVTIADGRTIGLRYIGEDPCPTCGHPAGVDLLEGCPLLEDNVKPVPTIA